MNNKGFTLVELIIVLAILGIISAIAVPKFTDIKVNAQVEADNIDAKILMNAINLAMTNGDLAQDDKLNKDNLLTYSEKNDLEKVLVPAYIDKIPKKYKNYKGSNSGSGNDSDNTIDVSKIVEWKTQNAGMTGRTYVPGNLVKDNGKIYACIQRITEYWDDNHRPSVDISKGEGTNWAQIKNINKKDTWQAYSSSDNLKTYSQGDLVEYEGKVYVCSKNGLRNSDGKPGIISHWISYNTPYEN